MLLASNPNWTPPRFCPCPRWVCLGALPSHRAPSVTASLNGNNPSDKELCSINPRSRWWAKHLLWTLHISSALSNAFPWKSAEVFKSVKPGTYKGWNPVWNTLLNTFLFQYFGSSSLGTGFITQLLERGTKTLPPASISLHCISFLIWKYSFSFLALISGLLCCSYFSPGFAWGIPSSPSALQICTAADTKHSQGCKAVPSTLQLKAVTQNSVALN